MHCYEVIPEGAVCKLYFDLEFHKPSNEGVDGKSLVFLLIQVVNICVLTDKWPSYPLYRIYTEKLANNTRQLNLFIYWTLDVAEKI